MSDPTSPNPETPLSDAAIGAVVALVRVCELYDRTVAHRAALRATVASLVTDASDDLAGVERSVAIAAAQPSPNPQMTVCGPALSIPIHWLSTSMGQIDIHTSVPRVRIGMP